MINENERQLGTIEFVNQQIIEFSASFSDLETKIYNGRFQFVRGINDFIYIRVNWNTLVLYRIIRARNNTFDKNISGNSLGENDKVIFSAEPVGTLVNDKFKSGTLTYPMVGNTVFAMDELLLEDIFSSIGDNLVSLGSINNYPNLHPKINLKKLLTSHVSILGNTGSGKSTTLRVFVDRLNKVSDKLSSLAKFFIFDVHGDYGELEFAEHMPVREMHLPLEKLSIQDWEAALLPSEKTQKPILNRALQIAKVSTKGKKIIYAILAKTIIRNETSGSFVLLKRAVSKWFDLIFEGDYEAMKALEDWCQKFSDIIGEDKVMDLLENEIPDAGPHTIDGVINEYTDSKMTLDGLDVAFNVVFGEEEAKGNKRARMNTETMMGRFRNLKSKYGNDGVLSEEHGDALTLERSTLSAKKFFVLDLTNLDDDALRLVSNYLCRSVFEFNLHFDRTKRNEMPFNYLYLDEAHRYVRENVESDDSTIFETIAREGRKFNVYLCVISQIPSELSKVVLSQTGAFFIHRIQNSADLDFIRRNVPSATDHLISRLAKLPAGTALLSGNAFEIPFELVVDAGEYGNVSSSLSPIEEKNSSI